MKLIQQTPGCSDFDLVLGKRAAPAFRVLLPERIVSAGSTLVAPSHTVPGEWAFTLAGARGEFAPSPLVRVVVGIECGEAEIRVDIEFINTSPRVLSSVTADFCAAVNHLPGAPGWCNRDFIPSVPLDRGLQGRYWYEKVTPHGLKALTAEGWVAMHPCPAHPDADAVGEYEWTLSPRTDAHACAARSADGSLLFFQAWDAPCRHIGPFPGNACMHLVPLVAELIEPEKTATIRGRIGILRGDWQALAGKINAELPAPAPTG